MRRVDCEGLYPLVHFCGPGRGLIAPTKWLSVECRSNPFSWPDCPDKAGNNPRESRDLWMGHINMRSLFHSALSNMRGRRKKKNYTLYSS